MNLEEIFNQKLTENGDIAFTKVSDDQLINILFLTEYYQKHIDEVPKLGTSDVEKLFAMFIRDPRFGLGRRDLGRVLMRESQCSVEQVVKAGRVDDLFATCPTRDVIDYCKAEIDKGNELVKKWMPRYSSRHLHIARLFAKLLGMNKQQYGKYIKCNTVENKLSHHKTDEINFEHCAN